MKYKFWSIGIVVTLLIASCNLLSDFGEDEGDWREYAPEDSSEESSLEEAEVDVEDMFDDEPPPVLDDDLLFFRDFSFELPLFSPNSAWNQRADDASVLPKSDAQILSLYRVLLGDISTLEGYDEPATTWPYMNVSLYEYTVPIFRAGERTQDVWICQDEGIVGWAHPKFSIETEGGPVTVPAPTGTVRPAGPENDDADGWLVLYDLVTFTAYDYFMATPYKDEDCLGFEGGLIGDQILQAGVVDFFDVRGPGVNQPGEGSYSAHAVGTPLLAGLILPEDIENGEIAHALAFAIPGPRNTSLFPENPKGSDFFYPASTTETDWYNTDSYALASGQRIRLKQTIVDEEGNVINESELAPITRMFLEALRKYGAYLVDNAGGFSFYAEDAHTAILRLSDNEVNALIGKPAGTSLPADMTKWQIVMETLGYDLELIPLAMSPGDEVPDPETAEIEIANFEVVEPAKIP